MGDKRAFERKALARCGSARNARIRRHPTSTTRYHPVPQLTCSTALVTAAGRTVGIRAGAAGYRAGAASSSSRAASLASAAAVGSPWTAALVIAPSASRVRWTAVAGGAPAASTRPAR